MCSDGPVCLYSYQNKSLVVTIEATRTALSTRDQPSSNVGEVYRESFERVQLQPLDLYLQLRGNSAKAIRSAYTALPSVIERNAFSRINTKKKDQMGATAGKTHVQCKKKKLFINTWPKNGAILSENN